MRAGNDNAPSPAALAVEVDPGLLRLITLRLESGSMGVATADSAKAALGQVAARRPDVVISDLRMDEMKGMTLYARLREQQPTLQVIILTARGIMPEAVAAPRQGAFSFLTKPFDSTELLDAVSEATRGQRQHADDSGWRQGIVAHSYAMEKLLSEVELVAQSDASVLIAGESGSGKEVIAQAIHAASPRSAGPFVALNCAAIPAELLESELFGHRRGAFTGAEKDRDGLFVRAGGGTLMLDEIGDMPAAFQAKLLRALQEKRIRPVGAAEETAIDVRLISATHRDLEAAIRDHEFREDLYYRANAVQVDIPPLRERPEDIVPLAEHFLDRKSTRLNSSHVAISYAVFCLKT